MRTLTIWAIALVFAACLSSCHHNNTVGHVVEECYIPSTDEEKELSNLLKTIYIVRDSLIYQVRVKGHPYTFVDSSSDTNPKLVTWKEYKNVRIDESRPCELMIAKDSFLHGNTGRQNEYYLLQKDLFHFDSKSLTIHDDTHYSWRITEPDDNKSYIWVTHRVYERNWRWQRVHQFEDKNLEYVFPHLKQELITLNLLLTQTMHDTKS